MADSADSSAAAYWIPADANPFGVDIVDCRPITHNVIAFTADQEVANSFLRLRESAGKEHELREPAHALTTDCYLVYPPATGADDGPLFKADQMEDKWDIYLYRPYIYFARSWTGNLIYRALTHFADDSSSIVEIAYDQSTNETPEFAICAVDFLLKSHVFGLVVANPLPPGAPRDPEGIARYSFSEFGRNTAFATFADTTDLEPLVPDDDAE